MPCQRGLTVKSVRSLSLNLHTMMMQWRDERGREEEVSRLYMEGGRGIKMFVLQFGPIGNFSLSIEDRQGGHPSG